MFSDKPPRTHWDAPNRRLGNSRGCAILGAGRPFAPTGKCAQAVKLPAELLGEDAVYAFVTDNDYLKRFVDAQADTYSTALRELVRGHKTGHWMWFIFPQLRGLGSSEMAHKYAIASLDEAQGYLAHPLLGSRLRECLTTLQDLPHSVAQEVFGHVDALKLRSSLTLFLRAGGGELFEAALQRWFSGQADERTDRLLEHRALDSQNNQRVRARLD